MNEAFRSKSFDSGSCWWAQFDRSCVNINSFGWRKLVGRYLLTSFYGVRLNKTYSPPSYTFIWIEDSIVRIYLQIAGLTRQRGGCQRLHCSVVCLFTTAMVCFILNNRDVDEMVSYDPS